MVNNIGDGDLTIHNNTYNIMYNISVSHALEYHYRDTLSCGHCSKLCYGYVALSSIGKHASQLGDKHV